MRAPEFWQRDGPTARLLAPLAFTYAAVARLRARLVTPARVPVPVVCVGNLTVGGTGKTPVAIALARWLDARGARPHLLSRGHGGRTRGPLRVEPGVHEAALVGDEPLLLAAAAPTWVARDRLAGARAAVEAGAGMIVMDDGFQNPRLFKDLGLVVVDGVQGLGNGRVLPAGPLREPVVTGLARASAVVLMGEDRTGLAGRLPSHLPLLRAELRLLEPEALRGRRVLAFAGIGRPGKLFEALQAAGAELAATRAFPDHHAYRRHEIEALLAEAGRLHATALTTEKDAVRLPADLLARVIVGRAEAVFSDPLALERLLGPLVARTSAAVR